MGQLGSTLENNIVARYKKLETNLEKILDNYLDYYFSHQDEIPTEMWAYKERPDGKSPVKFTDKNIFRIEIVNILRRYLDMMKNSYGLSDEDNIIIGFIAEFFHEVIYYDRENPVKLRGGTNIEMLRQELIDLILDKKSAGETLTPKLKTMCGNSSSEIKRILSMQGNRYQ